MDHINRRLLLAGMGVVGVAALTRAARGGPINPPISTVAPTNKTLAQIEPRIPITAETTPGDSQAVFTITSPGSYYLTSNIASTPTRSAIKIAAPDVTIDLSGYQISALSSLRSAISAVDPNPLSASSSITIRNGSISTVDSQTLTCTFKLLTLENIALSGYASSSIDHISAKSLTARACSFSYSFGTAIAADNITLADCTSAGGLVFAKALSTLAAQGCRFTKARFNYPSPARSLSFDQCVFIESAITDEQQSPTATVSLRDCALSDSYVGSRVVFADRSDFTNSPIRASIGRISDCSLQYPGGTPIFIDQIGRIERCTISNAWIAIEAIGPSIIDNCLISQCTGEPQAQAAAIKLSKGGHRVTNNILDNNTAGIILNPSSAVNNFPSFIANNTLTRNAQGNLINLASDAATAFTSVAAINTATTPSPFANIVN